VAAGKGQPQGLPLQDFLADCLAGQYEGAVVFGQDLLILVGAGFKPAPTTFESLKWTVFIGSNQNLTSESATYVLPSATYAEKNGTFTNFEGRVQKFTKAFEPLGESLPEWVILQELGKRLGISRSYASEEEIFQALASEIPSFHGLSYERLGDQGCWVKG
jgi:predicted molibdopterin-dependent oxidoreductase YjgC